MADQLAKRLTAKGTRQAYEDVLIKEYNSLNAIELFPVAVQRTHCCHVPVPPFCSLD